MSEAVRPTVPLVLHVFTVPESFIFLTGQLRFMREHGFDIALVASDGPYAAVARARDDVAIYAVDMPRRITPLGDVRAILALVRLMRRLRPAIVHAHTPKGGLLGMIAAIVARIPVRIYHMRGLPFESASGARRFLLRRTEWVSCHLAHRVICVSASLRSAAERQGVLAPRHAEVLAAGSGNGVEARVRFAPLAEDIMLRAATRDAYRIPRNADVVLFIGRVVADKGVRELAEAWWSVRERNPDAWLVMVGPEEPTDPVPEAVLERLRADSRVRMVGLVHETRPFYVASDLVVLPTYREGFPNVLLEAAAMELPVVATRVTGCVDAVADGETGLIVPPRDASALAAAIDRYLGDPVLRRQHGAAGRRRALTKFDQEHIWRALESLYRELLGTATGRDGVPARRSLSHAP